MKAEKITKISYTDKNYWTTKKPVEKNNLILAEDWNKFKVISTCNEEIEHISSLITNLFENPSNISSHITLSCTNLYPQNSFLSSINNLYNRVTGISTIQMKVATLENGGYEEQTYSSSFSANFLPLSAASELVNTFNTVSGDVNCLTTIKIGTEQFPRTGEVVSAVNLGSFFAQEELCVASINGGYKGDQNNNAKAISSITILQNQFNNLNSDYYLTITNVLYDKVYKKEATIPSSKTPTISIPQTVTETNIINRKMMENTVELNANEQKTIDNVIDWVCIVDSNKNLIQPTYAKLINYHTLKIKSPSAGTLYYITNVYE